MSNDRHESYQKTLGPHDKYLVLLCHCKDEPEIVIHDGPQIRGPGRDVNYISPLCDSWEDIAPESVKMIYGIHCPVYADFRNVEKFGWERDTGFGFFEESYEALKPGGLLIFPMYSSVTTIDEVFKYTFEYDYNSKRKWILHYAKNSPFYIATRYEDEKQFSNHKLQDLLVFEKIA